MANKNTFSDLFEFMDRLQEITSSVSMDIHKQLKQNHHWIIGETCLPIGYAIFVIHLVSNAGCYITDKLTQDVC